MLNADDEKILKVLTPETSRVYECLMKHNSTGLALEKLAGELKLTKPTVLHHCDRLIGAYLVQKDAFGNYVVKEIVRVSVARGLKSQLERAIIQWMPFLCIFLLISLVAILPVGNLLTLTLVVSACAAGAILVVREIKKAW
ncbi:Uncharacterised protein [uncultured archaeon]|nr:Uncharacterised protein [uncultured archaeon]